MAEHEGLSLGFDPAIPNEARMYDYFMGGKDNFAADREAARLALEVAPELPIICREGRRLLARMVRHLAAAGIRQFIDIGCGLPTQGNVHEVAQAAAPGSRVAYVDNDPVVALHAQALLENDEHTVVVQADMRQPERVLGHQRLGNLIDLDEPVAILIFFTLIMIPTDEEAARIVRGFRDAAAPGSYLAIAHSVSDVKPETTAKLAALYQDGGVVPGVPRRDQIRAKADVERLFDGMSLLDPGVVYLPAWRPDEGERVIDPESVWSVGGVARKER
ncbi:SAM-dependent methyltransferase [Sphaerisporangium sp. TRM90804]|uniref:SAM-dependent methyltransferase n=1 Tax=Sphaerisporangium sp. TRM90804 TaxID=3031113 RepID=UPI00244AC5AA|nr:SAM-dependent methyltransferase [Sphaerisporangium sp. TRM90804]MDH2424016.1 SAM-dependent methyltransferase [Sphaerisporangium sp. TRM90804]